MVAQTINYLLPNVAPRVIAPGERGEIAYLGCTGCHSYTGPPVQLIQAMYRDGAQALADHIAAPVKNWDGYPEMPPQNYLDAETRLAVGNRSVVPVRGGSQGLPNGD